MHMHPCMRANAMVQKLLAMGNIANLSWVLHDHSAGCALMQQCRNLFAMGNIANLSWVLREYRAGCRMPPALFLSRQNQSPDAVRSRNPSKSTLAHDTVTAAVSHKHHSIIQPYPVCLWFALFIHTQSSKNLPPQATLLMRFGRGQRCNKNEEMGGTRWWDSERWRLVARKSFCQTLATSGGLVKRCMTICCGEQVRTLKELLLSQSRRKNSSIPATEPFSGFEHFKKRNEFPKTVEWTFWEISRLKECLQIYTSENIELPARLLDYFVQSNKSNINQSGSAGLWSGKIEWLPEQQRGRGWIYNPPIDK